jgi:hypothetical protein
VRPVSLQEKIEMKKLTMIVVAVLFCVSGAVRAESSRRTTAISSNSQEKFFVGSELEFGLPIGNYADINGVGGALMVTGEYPLLDVLSATARIGFQFHMEKNIPGVGDARVHSIPVLLGAKYYLMPERQGLFGALELGMFDLLTGVSSGGVSASQSDLKFGAGLGIGYAMKEWSARVNVHSHDVGHFGDSIMVTAGVGYQFAGF